MSPLLFIAVSWVTSYLCMELLADWIYGEYIRSGGEKLWWYLPEWYIPE